MEVIGGVGSIVTVCVTVGLGSPPGGAVGATVTVVAGVDVGRTVGAVVGIGVSVEGNVADRVCVGFASIVGVICARMTGSDQTAAWTNLLAPPVRLAGTIL